VGCSVERHVVCVMRRPGMVGGDDMGAGVVTVVVRAGVEGDLGEVRIQRLVQGLLGLGYKRDSAIAGIGSPVRWDLRDHGRRRCRGERRD
jgi:hypothetical protein